MGIEWLRRLWEVCRQTGLDSAPLTQSQWDVPDRAKEVQMQLRQDLALMSLNMPKSCQDNIS